MWMGGGVVDDERAKQSFQANKSLQGQIKEHVKKIVPDHYLYLAAADMKTKCCC